MRPDLIARAQAAGVSAALLTNRPTSSPPESARLSAATAPISDEWHTIERLLATAP